MDGKGCFIYGNPDERYFIYCRGKLKPAYYWDKEALKAGWPNDLRVF